LMLGLSIAARSSSDIEISTSRCGNTV